MPEQLKPQKGNRKFQALVLGLFVLLAIFFGSALLKTDTALSAQAFGTVFSLVLTFVGGNVMEHRAAKVPGVPEPPKV